jgi:hypothetical protein
MTRGRSGGKAKMTMEIETTQEEYQQHHCHHRRYGSATQEHQKELLKEASNDNKEARGND